jgi:hypothetical protein
MPKIRTAIIVYGETPVNTIVLSETPEEAANYCANFDGNAVILDLEDEYQTQFINLTGCIAVEVTGLDPMPGVDSGWLYVNGGWVAPEATVDPISEQGDD